MTERRNSVTVSATRISLGQILTKIYTLKQEKHGLLQQLLLFGYDHPIQLEMSKQMTAKEHNTTMSVNIRMHKKNE